MKNDCPFVETCKAQYFWCKIWSMLVYCGSTLWAWQLLINFLGISMRLLNMLRSPVVHLSSRCSLRGRVIHPKPEGKDVFAFLGVPYAEQPARFEYPSSLQLWDGCRDAVTYGWPSTSIFKHFLQFLTLTVQSGLLDSTQRSFCMLSSFSRGHSTTRNVILRWHSVSVEDPKAGVREVSVSQCVDTHTRFQCKAACHGLGSWRRIRCRFII